MVSWTWHREVKSISDILAWKWQEMMILTFSTFAGKRINVPLEWKRVCSQDHQAFPINKGKTMVCLVNSQYHPSSPRSNLSRFRGTERTQSKLKIYVFSCVPFALCYGLVFPKDVHMYFVCVEASVISELSRSFFPLLVPMDSHFVCLSSPPISGIMLPARRLLFYMDLH